jgi:Cys-tRNA synthase (O-phospho-L-seryl-tRNA:Cys-tRNA synthase)
VAGHDASRSAVSRLLVCRKPVAALGISLATTNAVESLISRTRHVKRNVKRWRGGQMVVRWVAAGVLEAVKGFRRLKGHKELPKLVAAFRARDQQLGLVTVSEGKIA